MNKTVMIVEDDFLNMKLFNDLLKIRGYNTIQQTDGLGAYDAVHKHRPDLILMDMHLPGRSGLDIIAALKSDADMRHIPVIAVTAYAHQEQERLCLDRGCDGYMVKPISVASFYDTVSGFIQRIKPTLRVVL